MPSPGGKVGRRQAARMRDGDSLQICMHFRGRRNVFRFQEAKHKFRFTPSLIRFAALSTFPPGEGLFNRF